MIEAKLYSKTAGGHVLCNTCQWRCHIADGKSGVCKVYRNEGGRLFNLNYAKISSLAVDPIEKKPLFHFHPGTLCFSLGSWGCNFHCSGCQNWQIACPPDEEPWRYSEELTPERGVDMALKSNCDGIAWTYNEPGVWLEYTLKSAKLAKEKGLYTVYVTNGYSTKEALDEIAPYLDAWRVDVKGFSNQSYKKLAKVSKWRGILEVAARAKHKWQMHLEVVTNIVPTINNDEQQLKDISSWIKNELGEETPWHVTRFYPNRLLQHIPPTPIATIERAIAIGRGEGLKYVYAGNLAGNENENTFCPSCGKKVINRYAYQIDLSDFKEGKCRYCGTALNIKE
jgi:pyruvate formate lyase activating enzyme